MRTTSVAAILICALVAAGCDTMRPIAITVAPQQAKPFGGLEIGDLVEVKLSDGTRHRFEVEAIEGDAIVSNTGRRYTRGEIAELARETLDGPKTASLVAGIVAGGLIALKIMESVGFFGY